MAKIYAAPKELEKDLSAFDMDKDWQEQEQECFEKLRKYCKAHTDSKSKYVGTVFRIPMADSCAQYMVFRTKPFEMIHIPFGDAWDAPDYQTRGIRLADIKAQVEFDESMAKLMKDKA